MGVNKFDASGLQVDVTQTMRGQGVNGPAMGLAAPAAPETTMQVSAPKVDVAGPGMGGR